MKTRRKTPLEIKKVDAESCSIDVKLKIIHQLPFFKELSHDTIRKINNLFNDISKAVFNQANTGLKLD